MSLNYDGKLVLEFQSGNKEAFANWLNDGIKYFVKKRIGWLKMLILLKILLKIVGILIINKIRRFKDPKSFGSWALRIVYSKSLDVINAIKNELKLRMNYKLNKRLFEIGEDR